MKRKEEKSSPIVSRIYSYIFMFDSGSKQGPCMAFGHVSQMSFNHYVSPSFSFPQNFVVQEMEDHKLFPRCFPGA